jgi:predicted lipid-binding transport protein (Tim44 family)
VGRQPEEQPEAAAAGRPLDRPADEVAMGGVSLSGLAAVRARDPAFDLGKFLDGARGAYQLIVRAYAESDRPKLEPLLAGPVMAAFEAGMAQREAEGRTETVEFTNPPRADLDKAEVAADMARLTVRFLAEFRSRAKGPEGESVEDRRTAELWTFERNLKSRDPNWVLVRVDAAEA